MSEVASEIAGIVREKIAEADRANQLASLGSPNKAGKLGPAVIEKFVRAEVDARKEAILASVVAEAIAEV